MKHAKKDRPEAPTSKRPRPGLAPRTITMDIISFFGGKSSPNPDRGGGFSPMSWGFTLAVIGAAWLVGRFVRLIDWIERS